jgi:hypothetical protein
MAIRSNVSCCLLGPSSKLEAKNVRSGIAHSEKENTPFAMVVVQLTTEAIRYTLFALFYGLIAKFRIAESPEQ